MPVTRDVNEGRWTSSENRSALGRCGQAANSMMMRQWHCRFRPTGCNDAWPPTDIAGTSGNKASDSSLGSLQDCRHVNKCSRPGIRRSKTLLGKTRDQTVSMPTSAPDPASGALRHCWAPTKPEARDQTVSMSTSAPGPSSGALRHCWARPERPDRLHVNRWG